MVGSAARAAVAGFALLALALPARADRPAPAPPPETEIVTQHECARVGNAFAGALRADALAGMSAEYRARAEKPIEGKARARAREWVKLCELSVGGKRVLVRSISCALDVGTLAAFDACLGRDPAWQPVLRAEKEWVDNVKRLAELYRDGKGAVRAALGMLRDGAVEPDDLTGDLPPDADTWLIEAARDEALSAVERVAAVTLPGRYPTAQTSTFLEAWIARADLDTTLLAAVPPALARGFGKQRAHARRVTGLVKPLLAHASSNVRLGAVAGLALVGTAEARRLLEARLRHEGELEPVKEAIRRALGIKVKPKAKPQSRPRPKSRRTPTLTPTP